MAALGRYEFTVVVGLISCLIQSYLIFRIPLVLMLHVRGLVVT
jgi:hypothetical protein